MATIRGSSLPFSFRRVTKTAVNIAAHRAIEVAETATQKFRDKVTHTSNHFRNLTEPNFGPRHARHVANNIAKKTGVPQHAIAVELGSGFQEYIMSLEGAKVMTFEEVGLPSPSVTGHSANLYSVVVEGVNVLIFGGRRHLYETKFPPNVDEFVFPMRVAVLAGAQRLLMTHATGSVNEKFEVGDIIIIKDHLNNTGVPIVTGKHIPEFGKDYFVDQSTVWDSRLRELLHQAVTESGKADLAEGVVAIELGRVYETPAQIRALRAQGADQVGMSVVHSAVSAHRMGAQVLGLSLITNKGAGIDANSISHDDVVAAAVQYKEHLISIINLAIRMLVQDYNQQQMTP